MISYRIDRDTHVLTCHVTAGLRVLDAGQVMEQLFADPAFDATHRMLVRVDGDTVMPDLIARNALAELLRSWRDLHVPAKVALVLPGLAWRRIAVQLIESYELGTRNVRCFENEADAERWFREADCLLTS